MSMFCCHGVFLPAAGAALLLASTLAASKVMAYRSGGDLAEPLETIPFRFEGFSGTTNPPLEDAVLSELEATSYLNRTYRRQNLDASVFIAFYAQQRPGQAMHSPKHCLPGAGWEIWQAGSAVIQAGGQSYTVNRYRISRESSRRVVLYWYQSRERIFASEYLGKLLLARDSLTRHSTAAAIVRIIVPDLPEAIAGGTQLASDMILEMQRCFGAAAAKESRLRPIVRAYRPGEPAAPAPCARGRARSCSGAPPAQLYENIPNAPVFGGPLA